MQLAIMRMIRDYQVLLTDYETAMTRGHKLPAAMADMHGEACSDIATRMADHGMDAQAAMQLCIYGEFFEG